MVAEENVLPWELEIIKSKPTSFKRDTPYKNWKEEIAIFFSLKGKSREIALEILEIRLVIKMMQLILL